VGYVVKACCENKLCINKQISNIVEAVNENAAWEAANHLNLFLPQQCPLCGLDYLYFPMFVEIDSEDNNEQINVKNL
jgi:hypothetical protein